MRKQAAPDFFALSYRNLFCTRTILCTIGIFFFWIRNIFYTQDNLFLLWHYWLYTQAIMLVLCYQCVITVLLLCYYSSLLTAVLWSHWQIFGRFRLLHTARFYNIWIFSSVAPLWQYCNNTDQILSTTDCVHCVVHSGTQWARSAARTSAVVDRGTGFLCRHDWSSST